MIPLLYGAKSSSDMPGTTPVTSRRTRHSSSNPLVSVIILNWNGKKFLKECLTSLKKVTYTPLEVILVDNNSSDDSVQYVKKMFPWVMVVANPKNSGFAEGNNIGYRKSRGKYLLFLNNDTVVTPSCIEAMVKNFIDNSLLGCVQPQMRIMHSPHLQDEAGGYLTHAGFVYHYGYRKIHTLPLYRKKRYVFSAKGACMLIPRTVFEHVGLFDPDFFIFFEETDLCFRMWLSGYTVMYDPSTYIYHHVGGDTTDKYSYERRIYLTFKNMTCSYLKNFGTRNFLSVYPLFTGIQLLLVLYYLLTGKWYLVRAMARAYGWNVANLPKTLAKRHHIQKQLRRSSDSEINRTILHDPGFRYLYYSFTNTQFYTDSPAPSLS